MNIQPKEDEKLKAVARTANSDSVSDTNVVDDVLAAVFGDADDGDDSSSSSDAVDGVVNDGDEEEVFVKMNYAINLFILLIYF